MWDTRIIGGVWVPNYRNRVVIFMAFLNGILMEEAEETLQKENISGYRKKYDICIFNKF